MTIPPATHFAAFTTLGGCGSSRMEDKTAREARVRQVIGWLDRFFVTRQCGRTVARVRSPRSRSAFLPKM